MNTNEIIAIIKGRISKIDGSTYSTVEEIAAAKIKHDELMSLLFEVELKAAQNPMSRWRLAQTISP